MRKDQCWRGEPWHFEISPWGSCQATWQMWISAVRSASPAPKSLALAHVELTDSQKATMTVTDCLRQKVDLCTSKTWREGVIQPHTHTDILSVIHPHLNHETQMPSHGPGAAQCLEQGGLPRWHSAMVTALGNEVIMVIIPPHKREQKEREGLEMFKKTINMYIYIYTYILHNIYSTYIIQI